MCNCSLLASDQSIHVAPSRTRSRTHTCTHAHIHTYAHRSAVTTCARKERPHIGGRRCTLHRSLQKHSSADIDIEIDRSNNNNSNDGLTQSVCRQPRLCASSTAQRFSASSAPSRTWLRSQQSAASESEQQARATRTNNQTSALASLACPRFCCRASDVCHRKYKCTRICAGRKAWILFPIAATDSVPVCQQDQGSVWFKPNRDQAARWRSAEAIAS